MITLLLIVPIIGALLLIPIKENSLNIAQGNEIVQSSNQKMKNIALFTSLINLFISIFLWVQFDSNTAAFQFVSEFSELSFCHFNMGIDGISLFFVLLTTFITPIALLSNYTNITKNLKYFLISFLILETLQIATFVSLDLLLFYVFFESDEVARLQLSNSGDLLKLLIPIFNLNVIRGWNNYPEKVTSQKMCKITMDNRGSKSGQLNPVKEQRVDGSYLFKSNKLRCILFIFLKKNLNQQ